MADIKQRIRLRGGEEIVLRSVLPGDEQALYQFFQTIPPQSLLFLKDDVTNPAVIHKWLSRLDDDRVIPLIALCEDEIIGDATLHRSHHGWSPHVGELRVVVSPAWRRRGVAQALLRELVSYAASVGMEILEARMLEGQPDAQNVFEALGFKLEAVLRNQGRDRQGRRRSVLLFTHDVSALWDSMQDLIMGLEYGPRGD